MRKKLAGGKEREKEKGRDGQREVGGGAEKEGRESAREMVASGW